MKPAELAASHEELIIWASVLFLQWAPLGSKWRGLEALWSVPLGSCETRRPLNHTGFCCDNPYSFSWLRNAGGGGDVGMAPLCRHSAQKLRIDGENPYPLGPAPRNVYLLWVDGGRKVMKSPLFQSWQWGDAHLWLYCCLTDVGRSDDRLC